MAPQCLTLSLLACSWQSQKVFSQLPWSERARGDSAEAGEGGEGRWKERGRERRNLMLRSSGSLDHLSTLPCLLTDRWSKTWKGIRWLTHLHIHTWTREHTHKQIHTRTSRCTRILTHMHINTCIYTHMHTFTYEYTHTCTYTHRHIHTHTHWHTCTFTHTHAHPDTYTCTSRHIHMCTNTHAHCTPWPALGLSLVLCSVCIFFRLSLSVFHSSLGMIYYAISPLWTVQHRWMFCVYLVPAF